MRLLYITNSRMPTEKAHGLQIAKTIEALARIGVAVQLLIPRRKNHIQTNIADFYNIQNRLIQVKRVPDIVRPLQYLSERVYFPFQRLWFTLVSFFYGLFWRGTIYSRDLTISFLLSLFGKRVVYEDHQPKKRFHRLYKFFLRTIPFKVVVARHLIAEYQAMGIPPEAYIYAPNGVDIAEFASINIDKSLWHRELGVSKDRPVVLYVGHFYPWKGTYTLLDAATDIKAAVVLIGGTKEDYESVAQYIKKRGINNAYLHSFVPHRDIIRFIKSADVLILPNTANEERSQKYTTPIKLFEYMAAGVPIVASNISSFTPYLRQNENTLLYEPDNARDLAVKVNTVLNNKELANQISDQARQGAEQYDWKNRAKIIMNFITN